MILEIRLQHDDGLRVLRDPAIFDTIAEDGVTDIPEYEGCLFLCGYVPELMGCFILHRQNRVTLECHVQVLPDYRSDYTHEFCASVIKWTWANTDAEKLVAQIPFMYPNVRDCALRHGFEIEGVNRASYRKNGVLGDQWYLGLRKEP